MASREFAAYLYGGTEGVADDMARELRSRDSRIEIAGTETPPFRPLTTFEVRALARRINASRADLVWIGLGTPRQDYVVAALSPLVERDVGSGGCRLRLHLRSSARGANVRPRHRVQMDVPPAPRAPPTVAPVHPGWRAIRAPPRRRISFVNLRTVTDRERCGAGRPGYRRVRNQRPLAHAMHARVSPSAFPPPDQPRTRPTAMTTAELCRGRRPFGRAAAAVAVDTAPRLCRLLIRLQLRIIE